jgi:TonB family protein
MNNTVLSTVSYALNAAWQVPLLAAAGWVAARLLRRWGPEAQHVAWVATLLLCFATPALVARPVWLRSTLAVRQSVSSGSSFASIGVSGPDMVWRGATLVLPPWLIWYLFVLYVASLLYFALRFLWLLTAARSLVRDASLESWDPATDAVWMRARQAFVAADAAVLSSDRVHGVMTIGALRPSILLPAGFLAQAGEQEILTALGHELAHIERHDYLKNLLYEIAGIALAFHPLTWLVKTQIVETREMICDALVVDRLVHTKSYRESLLRLAQRMVSTKPRTVQAVGMFDANILEKRIMMMKTKRSVLGNPLRAGLAACAAILLTSTMIAATAFARPVDSQSTQDSSFGWVYKVGGDVTPPVIKTSIEARYPASANLPKGQSVICVIGLIVDRAGMPQEVHVVRSAGKDFDANALKAVQQYRFTPAKRAGNPVPVKISIEVNFKKY